MCYVNTSLLTQKVLWSDTDPPSMKQIAIESPKGNVWGIHAVYLLWLNKSLSPPPPPFVVTFLQVVGGVG